MLFLLDADIGDGGEGVCVLLSANRFVRGNLLIINGFRIGDYDGCILIAGRLHSVIRADFDVVAGGCGVAGRY